MCRELATVLVALSVTVGVGGCELTRDFRGWSAHAESSPCSGQATGEHGEQGEHGEEGEESGTQYLLDEVCDEIRNGARLVMSYDRVQDAFLGSVKNVSDDVLCDVRVEVHLDNGVELGPTEPQDLLAGENIDVALSAAAAHAGDWSGEG